MKLQFTKSCCEVLAITLRQQQQQVTTTTAAAAVTFSSCLTRLLPTHLLT